ncbi:MAG: TIGR00730 family Rossman fold protein [Saprospiraceae bacterium]
MINKVTIYCSSSNSLPPKYYRETKRIGQLLAKENITIIYGGGSSGLMGTLADSALENDGKVIGVIPRFMKAVEWDHKGVSLLIETEDMAERKKILIEGTDAVIALPGGVGTFEELFEVLSAKRLGLFTKPIIIYNFQGFYNPIIEMLETCVEENFMGKQHRDIWTEVTQLEDLIEAMKNAPAWSESAIDNAKT